VNVLFLALSGARGDGVMIEAGQVVSDGGRAVVLTDTFRPWRAEDVPPGVELLGIGGFEKEHLPLRIEHVMVFGPERVLGAVAKGSVRRVATRAQSIYRRRLANPIHRRAMVAYRKIWRNHQYRHMMASLVRGGDFDYIVVANFASITLGARIQRDLDAAAQARPVTRFSIDHLADAPVAVG
jgi:hypothetical protein